MDNTKREVRFPLLARTDGFRVRLQPLANHLNEGSTMLTNNQVAVRVRTDPKRPKTALAAALLAAAERQN